MKKKLRKAGKIFATLQLLMLAVVFIFLALGFRASEHSTAKSSAAWPKINSVNGLTAIIPDPIVLPTPPPPPPPPPMPPKPDCSVQTCLALTFDDGPTTAITPRVLDVLEKHGVHATFFVVGSRVAGHEALLQRMNKDGDEIGSHSWSHANLTKLPPQQVKDEVALAQAAVAGAGVPAPTIFRPPYGAFNAAVEADVPMAMAMWNVDPEDWKAKTPQEIIDKVKAGSAPGRVIVLHDQRQMTVDALDPLIAELKTQYQLVTFSELFGLTPGQRGYFYGR